MMLLTMMALIAQSPNSLPKQQLYTADGQKVVCRLVHEAHSRIPSRICRTEAEWVRIAKENEKEFADAVR